MSKTDHGFHTVHSESVSFFQLRSTQTGHCDPNIAYLGQTCTVRYSSTGSGSGASKVWMYTYEVHRQCSQTGFGTSDQSVRKRRIQRLGEPKCVWEKSATDTVRFEFEKGASPIRPRSDI